MAKKQQEKATEKEELKQPESAETKEEKEENKEDLLREALIQASEWEKKFADAEKKLSETEDRYLRTLAEYDNFKKRTVKEKEDLYFAAQSDIIRKLLPVFDNFDRAKQFSTGEEYAKGVEMIVNQFGEITKKMDIREIAKEGDVFDPVFHEAVFREEKEGVEENTILQVLQKGYAIGDKVIRHAMVKVSG